MVNCYNRLIYTTHPQKEKMKIPDKIQQRDDYQACANFHGHVCMGLTIGYLASKLAIKLLKEKRAADEELICITETDACCCDAIQVLTGCTFGKGNLIYRDIGKMAFTFGSRSTGEGVRLVLRADIKNIPGKEQSLALKIRETTATTEEISEYEKLYETRCEALFDGGPEAFFTVEDMKIPLPPKARMAPSKMCDICGEAVMETKLTSINSKNYCRACREQ
jgi:formylmethanofuran dehydrogenase subunit E